MQKTDYVLMLACAIFGFAIGLGLGMGIGADAEKRSRAKPDHPSAEAYVDKEGFLRVRFLDQ